MFLFFFFIQSIRENLITTLTRKFVDEMKLYQQAQQQYKADIKKKVKRQIQVIKPDATDEEVDQVMRSEGGRDALMKQAVLSAGVNDQIQWVQRECWNIKRWIKTGMSQCLTLFFLL